MRRRVILSLICILSMLFIFAVPSFAEPVSGDPEPEPPATQPPVTAAPETTTTPATTVDASVPRFMVTSFKVEGGALAPEKKTLLTVELKNMSSTKPIRNIKLAVTDETGGIAAEGTGTQFVQAVNPNGVYTWTVNITASKSAPMGEHHLIVSSEYEDPYYTVYKGSDTLSVNVTDVPLLSFEGMMLPQTLSAGSMDAFTVKIVNTGKAVVRNVRIELDVPGVNTGGAVFVGEIPAGEQRQAQVNLRIDGEPGAVQGSCQLIYEDEFGKGYALKQDMRAQIVAAEESTGVISAQPAGQKSSVLWMILYGVLCVLIGGAVGFVLRMYLVEKKSRKDEAAL